MKRSRIKRKIRRLFELLLLKLFPLKNIIIFESYDDFSDNSRALYDYMISRGYDKKYKFVWLVRKQKKFEKLNLKNTKFIKLDPNKFREIIVLIYYLTAAKFGFFTHKHPLFRLNRGEVFVNLWHGSGLKNINFLNLGYRFDYVIYNSDYYQKAYANFVRFPKVSSPPEKRLLPLGNPRTDLMFENKGVLNKLVSQKYNQVLIWLPTYRTHKNGFESFKVKNNKAALGLPIFEDIEQVKEINKILDKYNELLLIKPHPSQDLSFVTEINYSNIKFITNEDLEQKGIQLYSLLGETDVLITDYSSVYVDYLLIGKPIGFTIDDMADYKTGYIFENPLDHMPGKHIKNFADFKAFIEDISNDQDGFEQERQNMNVLLNKYRDGKIAERIVDFFNL